MKVYAAYDHLGRFVGAYPGTRARDAKGLAPANTVKLVRATLTLNPVKLRAKRPSSGR